MPTPRCATERRGTELIPPRIRDTEPVWAFWNHLDIQSAHSSPPSCYLSISTQVYRQKDRIDIEERIGSSKEERLKSRTTMPSGESYLVIGGCGFLGRHIVEQLLARGETQVAVFDIVQRHFDKYVGLFVTVSKQSCAHTEANCSNVTFFIGDVSKPEDISNALRKVSRESSGSLQSLIVVRSDCSHSHRIPRT